MAEHHICTLISYFAYCAARAVLRSPSVPDAYITALPIGSCRAAARIFPMLHMQSLRLHRPLQVLSGAWRAAGSHPPRKQGATAHQQRASNMAASSTNEAAAVIAARQAELFSRPDTIQEFLAPLPEDITQRLATIVASVPALGPTSRVCDVGSGTGCLIPHMQARGVVDILAVDVAPGMLQQLRARYPDPGTCGNDPGVRTWLGDFLELPPYQGPFDAVFMNAVFGNLADPRTALLKAALSLKPGGFAVVSHPMGRTWHQQLAIDAPDMVPHLLPDAQGLQGLIQDLPLQVVQYTDDPELYLAVLQVPPSYRLQGAPLCASGPVVRGFGRGSRQLGIPTANIDPAAVAQQLGHLPQGVYFGWAQLQAPEGWPAEDGGVYKMVMNIGTRPTVNEGDEAATVEVHILHTYSQEEFYGAQLSVAVVGFLRPEMRFAGLQQLLGRIKTDIALAKLHTEDPELQQHAHASIFKQARS